MGSPEERAARAEALADRLALAQYSQAPQSSVEITVSAKGVIQPTVKVYHADPEYALQEAKRLFLEAQAFAVEHGAAG